MQFESRAGDLLATVDVLVPAHVSKKAEELVKSLDAMLSDEDPRADLIQKAGLL